MHTTRICLWSSPRNISTAMMYSFAQRPDTIAFDEPLYAHFLRVTGIDHPGKEETLQSQENDGNRVVKELMLGDFDKPVVFFKQMTHHLVDLPLEFLSQTKNILLIRDPKEVLISYSKVIVSASQLKSSSSFKIGFPNKSILSVAINFVSFSCINLFACS